MLQIILGVLIVLFLIGIASKLIELAWGIIKFLLGVAIIIGLIVLGISFWPVVLGIVAIVFLIGIVGALKEGGERKKWIKEVAPAYDEAKFDNTMVAICNPVIESDQNVDEYKFVSGRLPYGRINSFLNYFGKSIYDDEVYYYSARPSCKRDELREYGFLITRTGIYSSKQITSSEGESHSKEIVVPFSGLWKTKWEGESLKLYYLQMQSNEEKVIQIHPSDIGLPLACVNSICEQVMNTRISHILIKELGYEGGTYQQNVENAQQAFNKNQRINSAKNVTGVAGTMGANVAVQQQFGEIKNYMNGARGHGYGAEYANNTLDKVSGKHVINEAQNLDEFGRQVKNGADRIVDGINIQTKYYKTASESIGAAFEHKQAKYLNPDGSMMQIEVPRDQYVEACNLMQKRIDSGQVPGARPGESASKYVRKGHFTYAQSYNVCLSGTIESLTVDALNGAVCSATAGGVSALMVFAIAVWNGQDLKEASKAGLSTGLKVLGRGTLIYTLTMQLSRSEIANPFVKEFMKNGNNSEVCIGFAGIENPIFNLSENLAKQISESSIAQTGIGQALGLQTLTGKNIISGGITGVVVFGPDICRALAGRISMKQLFKNSAIGASGIGGSLLGQALIPIPIVGAMIGGAIGGFVAKSVLDEFVEDDAKYMFQILKEEFLDVVMLSNLTSEEFEKVMNMTLCNPKLSKLLRDIYASQAYREFAREAIVSAAVINVLSERQAITIDMVDEGYAGLLEDMSSVAIA